MFSVQVYAVTLYVDEAAAKAGLQGAGSDAAVCQALTTGAYTKAFQASPLSDRSRMCWKWQRGCTAGKWDIALVLASAMH